MVVCKQCGNKRCPHATDHRLTCTGSNEPGQLGSVHGVTLTEEEKAARLHCNAWSLRSLSASDAALAKVLDEA